MNFIEVALTEMRYISKQGFTTVLILTYPWIIILILAEAFSTAEFETVSVSVFSQNASDLEAVRGMVTSNINLISVNSRNEVLSDVLSGKSVVGLIIRRDANDRMVISFYQNPLKGALAAEIVARIQTAFNDLSGHYIEKNMVGVWIEMFNASDQIRTDLAKIPILKEAVANSSRDLTLIEQRLNSSDILELRSQLDLADSELNSTSSELNSLSVKIDNMQQNIDTLHSYQSVLTLFDNKLSEAKTKIENARAKIPGWRSKIQSQISSLNNEVYLIDSYLSNIQLLKSQMQNSENTAVYNLLSQAESSLISAKSEIVSSRDDLIDADDSLASADTELAVTSTEIDAARSKISDTKSSLGQVTDSAENTLRDAKNSIVTFQKRIILFRTALNATKQKIDTFADTLSLMKGFTSDMRAKLNSFSSEIDEAEILLNNTASIFDRFEAKNPMSYAPPAITRNTVGPNAARSIDIFLPSIIAIVAMLSCLMFPMIMSVKQRDEGVEFRMKFSNTSLNSIFFGRFLGNYIIGLVQALIVAAFAVFVLNIFYHDVFSFFVAILLAPLAFVSIGMFLSFIVSRESTAVLLTLLLGIPMLFLSGTLIPREHIHGMIRFVSDYLPLSASSDLLNTVTLKDQSIEFALPQVAILLSYSVISLLIGRILIERQK
jgi:ABC-type multidrug transport system permease subunit